MKSVIAIFFIALYAAFASLAFSGSAVLKCDNGACKRVVSFYQETNAINTDNDSKNCNHKPAITAHIFHKQPNVTTGSGNKYTDLYQSSLHQYCNNSLHLLQPGKLYPKAVTSASCPL